MLLVGDHFQRLSERKEIATDPSWFSLTSSCFLFSQSYSLSILKNLKVWPCFIKRVIYFDAINFFVSFCCISSRMNPIKFSCQVIWTLDCSEFSSINYCQWGNEVCIFDFRRGQQEGQELKKIFFFLSCQFTWDILKTMPFEPNITLVFRIKREIGS